jgi:DNA processing protein
MALRHWLQLALTEGIGPILTTRLIAAAGSATAACEADAVTLRGVEGIGSTKSRDISEALRRAAVEVDAELSRCAAAGVMLVCQEDVEFPPALKVIPDPPPLLYVRGTLQPRDLYALAVVGSRRCSHYGREQGERFGTLLAQAGMTVVSGGARGIDSAAHRGALMPAEGRTIAVLGCGVDIDYPPENHALFEQIAQRGAVVSEFAMGQPPLKENFPRRNRIISGLSRGVLVVEADVASGALITARQACDDHGRPVFAIPGRVDNPMSAGPHSLIRDGAILVSGLDDILQGLGPLPEQAMLEIGPSTSAEPPLAAVQEISLNDAQARIVSGIDDDPTALDTIIAASELPAEVVLRELTLLTLRGVVKRVDGQNYVRGRR